jgi:hypothetical protein
VDIVDVNAPTPRSFGLFRREPRRMLGRRLSGQPLGEGLCLLTIGRRLYGHNDMKPLASRRLEKAHQTNVR